jgi:hypothetical protein
VPVRTSFALSFLYPKAKRSAGALSTTLFHTKQCRALGNCPLTTVDADAIDAIDAISAAIVELRSVIPPLRKETEDKEMRSRQITKDKSVTDTPASVSNGLGGQG